MSLRVSKKVLRRAKEIVADTAETLNNVLDNLEQSRPLPVVTFDYPRHGLGTHTTRFVRVTEMDGTHLRGLEIHDEFDEEPGRPKTYLIEKIRGGGDVRLLHLAPETE
jgi:hypothetical protein